MSIRTVFTSLWLYVALQVLGILLLAGGVFERMPLALLLTVIVTAAVLLLPTEKALTLVIASIPLAIAVPIVPALDTFASWRILVLALFFSLVLRTKPWKENPKKILASILGFEWILLGIMTLGVLSLTVANDPSAGIRKLLFLANAGIFYVVLRSEVPRHMRAVLMGLLACATFVFLFGLAQYLTVQLVSLYDFWQGWAHDTIPVFYGTELARVLAKSNTWFSFHEDGPPTLRVFSVFPDSHSFAIFSLLMIGIGFWLTLARRVRSGFILIAASSLALFLSGSRGTWMGAFVPFLLTVVWTTPQIARVRTRLLASGIHEKIPELRKMLLVWFVVALMFPVASFLAAHATGAGAESQEAKTSFRRAKSIFDVDELSNRTRLAIWRESVRAMVRHPVLGVGLANFPQVLGEDVAAGRRGASAHNLYLDWAVEAGIFAGILVALFFGMLMWHSLRRSQVWFFAVAAWIAVYNLVDVVLVNDKVLLVFLAVLALAHNAQEEKYP